MPGVEDRRERARLARVAFAAGTVLGLVVGGGVAAGIRIEEEISLQDYLLGATAVGTLLAAIVGSLALVFAKGQIDQARRTAAVDRAAALSRRFATWEFSGHVMAARKYCAVSPENQDEKWTQYRACEDDIRHVGILWNFFDELGMKHGRRLVDRDLIERYFLYASLDLYRDLAWLIERQRKAKPRWKGPTEWEKMNAVLEQSDAAESYRSPPIG